MMHEPHWSYIVTSISWRSSLSSSKFWHEENKTYHILILIQMRHQASNWLYIYIYIKIKRTLISYGFDSIRFFIIKRVCKLIKWTTDGYGNFNQGLEFGISILRRVVIWQEYFRTWLTRNVWAPQIRMVWILKVVNGMVVTDCRFVNISLLG